MGWGASTECNRKGPDYFGLFASEVAELLSQDGDFLPFSEQIFEKCEEVNSAVEEKNSSMSTYNAKEFSYTGGSASLFSDCFGSHVSDFRTERLKLLLRQSIVALSREVDEVHTTRFYLHLHCTSNKVLPILGYFRKGCYFYGFIIY